MQGEGTIFAPRTQRARPRQEISNVGLVTQPLSPYAVWTTDDPREGPEIEALNNVIAQNPLGHAKAFAPDGFTAKWSDTAHWNLVKGSLITTTGIESRQWEDYYGTAITSQVYFSGPRWELTAPFQLTVTMADIRTLILPLVAALKANQSLVVELSVKIQEGLVTWKFRRNSVSIEASGSRITLVDDNVKTIISWLEHFQYYV